MGVIMELDIIKNELESKGYLQYYTDDELFNIINLLMDVDKDITLDKVILDELNRKKIYSFLDEYKFRDTFLRHKLYPRHKLLFSGASGTGKTYLAKALANTLGFRLLYIDIALALADVNVVQNIASIFKLANHLGNCVIFLDECDAVAMSRDMVNMSDGGVSRKATNSLFQYIDQLNKTNIFISATNYLEQLDAAFERRFDLKLEFRIPENIIDAIYKFKFDSFTIHDDTVATLDKENINSTKKDIILRSLSNNKKLSYYGIQTVVENNMKKALMRDTKVMQLSDILNDLAVVYKVRINI